MTKDIDREIVALAGEPDVESAARRLKLIGAGDRFVVTHASAWKRGGAETYILEFTIDTQLGPKPLLLKACTPAIGSASPEAAFRRWLARRAILSKSGVATPTLFGAGSCVLLEEYVSDTFVHALETEMMRPALLHALGFTAGRLAALGFRPLCLIANLRSRGEDCVLIDFGEDLGEPSNHAGGLDLVDRLRREMRNEGIRLNRAEDRIVEDAQAHGLRLPQ